MSTVIEDLQAEVAEAVDKYRAVVLSLAEGKPVPRSTIEKSLAAAGKYPADLVADVNRATTRFELAKGLAELPALEKELDKLSEQNRAAELEIETAAKEYQQRCDAARDRIESLRPPIHALLEQIGERSSGRNVLARSAATDPEIIQLRNAIAELEETKRLRETTLRRLDAKDLAAGDKLRGVIAELQQTIDQQVADLEARIARHLDWRTGVFDA